MTSSSTQVFSVFTIPAVAEIGVTNVSVSRESRLTNQVLTYENKYNPYLDGNSSVTNEVNEARTATGYIVVHRDAKTAHQETGRDMTIEFYINKFVRGEPVAADADPLAEPFYSVSALDVLTVIDYPNLNVAANHTNITSVKVISTSLVPYVNQTPGEASPRCAFSIEIGFTTTTFPNGKTAYTVGMFPSGFPMYAGNQMPPKYSSYNGALFTRATTDAAGNNNSGYTYIPSSPPPDFVGTRSTSASPSTGIDAYGFGSGGVAASFCEVDQGLGVIQNCVMAAANAINGDVMIINMFQRRIKAIGSTPTITPNQPFEYAFFRKTIGHIVLGTVNLVERRTGVSSTYNDSCCVSSTCMTPPNDAIAVAVGKRYGLKAANGSFNSASYTLQRKCVYDTIRVFHRRGGTNANNCDYVSYYEPISIEAKSEETNEVDSSKLMSIFDYAFSRNGIMLVVGAKACTLTTLARNSKGVEYDFTDSNGNNITTIGGGGGDVNFYIYCPEPLPIADLFNEDGTSRVNLDEIKKSRFVKTGVIKPAFATPAFSFLNRSRPDGIVVGEVLAPPARNRYIGMSWSGVTLAFSASLPTGASASIPRDASGIHVIQYDQQMPTIDLDAYTKLEEELAAKKEDTKTYEADLINRKIAIWTRALTNLSFFVASNDGAAPTSKWKTIKEYIGRSGSAETATNFATSYGQLIDFYGIMSSAAMLYIVKQDLDENGELVGDAKIPSDFIRKLTTLSSRPHIPIPYSSFDYRSVTAAVSENVTTLDNPHLNLTRMLPSPVPLLTGSVTDTVPFASINNNLPNKAGIQRLAIKRSSPDTYILPERVELYDIAVNSDKVINDAAKIATDAKNKNLTIAADVATIPDVIKPSTALEEAAAPPEKPSPATTTTSGTGVSS
jgi:hypothetical protein